MAKPSPLKKEAIRLRVEDRLSLREIHVATGASKGSLSLWLRDLPLTEEEKSNRRKRIDRSHLRKERGEESKYHKVAAPTKMSKQQKAKISEAAVLFRLTVHGYNPFGSVFDGDKTDWLVEVPQTGKVLKLQVKWARDSNPHGLPCIFLTCTEGHNKRRRYRPGEFDFIVGYDYYSDTCYIFSESEVAHLKASVTITPDAAETWDKLRGH